MFWTDVDTSAMAFSGQAILSISRKTGQRRDDQGSEGVSLILRLQRLPNITERWCQCNRVKSRAFL